MCFKNCDKESRKIPITLGVLVVIFIIGLFFAVSSQGEKNYEAFLKSRLAQHVMLMILLRLIIKLP